MAAVAQGPALHEDGSMCLVGMSSIPRKHYRPCCTAFESHLVSCANDLRFEYWERCDRWFVIVADGSGDGIPIRYCPHCGTRLPRFGQRSGH